MAVYIKRAAGTVSLHEISIGAVIGIAIGGAVVLGVFVVLGIVLVFQWKHERSVANVARRAGIQRSRSASWTNPCLPSAQLSNSHNNNGKRSGWAKLSSNENLREMSQKARLKLVPQMSKHGTLPIIQTYQHKVHRKQSFAESNDATCLTAIYESYQMNSRSEHRAVEEHAFQEMRKKTSQERQNPNTRYSQGLPVPESKIIPGLKPVQFSLCPSPHLSTERKVRCKSWPVLLDLPFEDEVANKPISPPKTIRHIRSRSFGAVNLGTAPLGPLPPLPTTSAIAKRDTIRKVSMASTLSIVSTDSMFQNVHDIHQLGATPTVPAKGAPQTPRNHMRVSKELPTPAQGKNFGVDQIDSSARPERPISRIRTIIGETSNMSSDPKQLPLLPTKPKSTPAMTVHISEMHEASITKE